MIGAGQGIVCLRLRGNVLKECILKGNSLYSGKQSKVFDFLQTTSLNGKRGLTNEKENEFRNEKFYECRGIVYGKCGNQLRSGNGDGKAVRAFFRLRKFPSVIKELFQAGRKVYQLVSLTEKQYANSSSEVLRGIPYRPGDFDGWSSGNYFSDLFTLLMEEEAILYGIAKSADKGVMGKGGIFISLPKEMCLRMKTMISFSLSPMQVEEMENKAVEEEKLLPGDLFIKAMTRFFLEIRKRKKLQFSDGEREIRNQTDMQRKKRIGG